MSIELTGEFAPEKNHEQSAGLRIEERAESDSHHYGYADGESSVVSISNYVDEYYQMKLPFEGMETNADGNSENVVFISKSDVETNISYELENLKYIKNGGGTVNEALQSGYNTENAIIMGRAQKAYSNSARIPKEPVKSKLLSEFKIS